MPTHFNTAEAQRVKRIAYRASYEASVIYAILDAGYICHVSFVHEGLPAIIPMTYWRRRDYIYLHAATKSRFTAVCRSTDICICVTLLDGLVLGHSPINHSANYRAVIAHGRPEVIDEAPTKEAAMRDFFAKTIPGRWEELRPIRAEEIAAVTVFRLKLDQVAAKTRNEFSDQEEHMPELPLWTGIIPIHQRCELPVADPRFAPTPLPTYLTNFDGKPPFEERVDNVRD
jgi:nitroimidazol reductase NimA-like FMN-containing flavoprotein (pyridoxamine 5'-phosphate oxidase superfamily)